MPSVTVPPPVSEIPSNYVSPRYTNPFDIPQPPRSYRADIGYVSRRGEFFVLARSNVVTPPKAGADASGAFQRSLVDGRERVGCHYSYCSRKRRTM